VKALAATLRRPPRPPRAAGRLRAALTPGPRARRGLIVAGLVVALLAGLYMLWLRDSSLVAVDDVTVTGVQGRDAERIRTALVATAETMTTLHVDRERLANAAAAFPSVARVEATPDFPNGLRIEVVEHRPVAIAQAGGRSQPLAADGSVLAGIRASDDLPKIDLAVAMPARRLGPGAARDAAAVAGAAPAKFVGRVESIGRKGGAMGVVATLDDGTELIFGAPAQLAAKWAAAVRVLADDDAQGATYLDVRIPERPVAGGLAPVVAPTYDPITGAPIDPATGLPIDPVTGAPTYTQP